MIRKSSLSEVKSDVILSSDDCDGRQSVFESPDNETVDEEVEVVHIRPAGLKNKKRQNNAGSGNSRSHVSSKQSETSSSLTSPQTPESGYRSVVDDATQQSQQRDDDKISIEINIESNVSDESCSKHEMDHDSRSASDNISQLSVASASVSDKPPSGVNRKSHLSASPSSRTASPHRILTEEELLKSILDDHLQATSFQSLQDPSNHDIHSKAVSVSNRSSLTSLSTLFKDPIPSSQCVGDHLVPTHPCPTPPVVPTSSEHLDEKKPETLEDNDMAQKEVSIYDEVSSDFHQQQQQQQQSEVSKRVAAEFEELFPTEPPVAPAADTASDTSCQVPTSIQLSRQNSDLMTEAVETDVRRSRISRTSSISSCVSVDVAAHPLEVRSGIITILWLSSVYF